MSEIFFNIVKQTLHLTKTIYITIATTILSEEETEMLCFTSV